MVQLSSVDVPERAYSPPPLAADVLPERVELVSAAVPEFTMAPPPILEASVAELPEKVLLVMVAVPSPALYSPPASPALLFETVLLTTVNVPVFQMPPPEAEAVFPVTVTRSSVTGEA